MGHFARVQDGTVTQVIVAEQDFINTGAVGDPSEWVQTSYNTRNGVHYDPETGEPSADQSKALRKNYAGIGYIYDAGQDAFFPPKPFASWVIDDETGQWNPPVAMPTDAGEGDPPKSYEWNEDTVSWVEVTA
jgi:hypothetical protein